MFSITDADTQVITLRHALLFPFVGSITLMIMFLFFKYLSWFFLAYIIALSLGSIGKKTTGRRQRFSAPTRSPRQSCSAAA